MHGFRRFTLSALLAGLACVLACSDATRIPPTGVVRGRVARVYADEPIAGASVSVGDETQTTDAQGRFLFKRIEQGSATVTVTADTYQDLARGFTVGEYQTLELELTPQDTLVDVSGLVAHRVDGPQRVRVDHDHGSVWTDSGGRWSLADVPMGRLTLTVNQPPYDRHVAEVIAHTDGQEFLQTLTRDTTISWWIEDDAYIFTRDDSLNANRGQVPKLWVTEELGRTAVFSLEIPDLGWPWATVEAARLDLHVSREPVDEGDMCGPQDLVVSLMGLEGPFSENSIDAYTRPAAVPLGTLTFAVACEPPNQPVSIDLMPVLDGVSVPFWRVGLALGTTEEQAHLGIRSGEYGVEPPEFEDRPRATYRLSF